VLERENGRLVVEVEDIAWASEAGRSNVLKLLGAFAGQAETVRLHLPDSDPLTLHYASKYVHPGRPPLQVRVIDVKSALGSLKSEVPIDVLVRVADRMCAWNDGTFRVRADDSGTGVERENGEAQVE